VSVDTDWDPRINSEKEKIVSSLCQRDTEKCFLPVLLNLVSP